MQRCDFSRCSIHPSLPADSPRSPQRLFFCASQHHRRVNDVHAARITRSISFASFSQRAVHVDGPRDIGKSGDLVPRLCTDGDPPWRRSGRHQSADLKLNQLELRHTIQQGFFGKMIDVLEDVRLDQQATERTRRVEDSSELREVSSSVRGAENGE